MGLSDFWFKNAVIYAVDVDSFYDSDGDGDGDLRGLIRRLDHIERLGADCLWLLPFYPTPNRDNGYDVSDHYGVEPRLGSPGEFVELLREARSRGIRLLVDLVANHTSDRHPWFRAARQDPDSRYRDYYIWEKERPDDPRQPIVFHHPSATRWTFDEAAGAHYYHTFYEFEPDLNAANPAVRKEIQEIIGFWIQLGVSGFRMDAAPHMLDRKGSVELPDDPHEILREIGRFARIRKGNVVLLGETDVEPHRYREFFSEDQLNMLFNFLLDNYLFLALAREESEPIRRALTLLPPRPREGQWANFLRNLDELDLERLTASERDEVYAAFAPKEEMRIYGRGIRRRVAPMLGGDGPKLRLAYSLLFSLPGTPVLVYGDEIGMGEDLSLEGRNSVRTPMQWSDAANAGFSTADPDRLVRPIVQGRYGPRKVNVAAQENDPGSLLNWMRRIIATRRITPEFGWGGYEVIETGGARTLAHRCDWQDGAVLAVHNLGGEPATAEIGLDKKEMKRLTEFFADREYDPIDPGAGAVPLGAYGFRWFRLGGDGGSHTVRA